MVNKIKIQRDEKGRFMKGEPSTKGMLGKKQSDYFKTRMSEVHKGKKISEETKRKMSLASKGKPKSSEHKIKLSLAKLGKKLSKEHIRNCLRKRNKSSLEIKFETIINQLNLPYRFVGNGELIIARKNPDFINSKGEKIAIEVFYRRHKEQFRNGLEKWKAERLKIFNQEGWELIFFDETQVNEKKILEVLNE